MIGAIGGDIIGSIYEHEPIKTKEFPLFKHESKFTDDSVLTIAVADSILTGKTYLEAIWELGGKYPNAGYGASFVNWLRSIDPEPYNSWGNGAAMRVSPVSYAFDTVERVLEEAEKTAIISHNHAEGIKGAKAIALSVYLARKGCTKAEIKREVIDLTGYNLNRRLDDIRPEYKFDVSSQGSVPESIICFLESESYEDSVRNAVSLGGDSDTQACISGAIAGAYYREIPMAIKKEIRSRLGKDLWSITEAFTAQFCV